MAHEFTQTNTAAYDSNNGHSLLYKSRLMYTMHVVRWFMNLNKPMLRLNMKLFV